MGGLEFLPYDQKQVQLFQDKKAKEEVKKQGKK
jgi:hypothetical protein